MPTDTVVSHCECGAEIIGISRDCGACSVHCEHSTCYICNDERRRRAINDSTYTYVWMCLEEVHCDNCELCEDHCACHECGACYMRYRSSNCSHCDECTNCCECQLCNDCDSNITAGDCRCVSEDDGEDRENDPGTPFRVKSRADTTLFSCTRLVGLEIEYNTVENGRFLSKWEDEWRA